MNKLIKILTVLTLINLSGCASSALSDYALGHYTKKDGTLPEQKRELLYFLALTLPIDAATLPLQIIWLGGQM